MYRQSLFLIVASFLVASSVSAALNAYLNFTGEAKGETTTTITPSDILIDDGSSEMAVGDSGEEVDSSERKNTEPIDKDSGDPDRPIITGVVPSGSTEMNKAELIEDISPTTDATGREQDDRGSINSGTDSKDEYTSRITDFSKSDKIFNSSTSGR